MNCNFKAVMCFIGGIICIQLIVGLFVYWMQYEPTFMLVLKHVLCFDLIVIMIIAIVAGFALCGHFMNKADANKVEKRIEEHKGKIQTNE